MWEAFDSGLRYPLRGWPNVAFCEQVESIGPGHGATFVIPSFVSCCAFSPTLSMDASHVSSLTAHST